MSAPAPSGGFSLFPNTGRPPSRTQGTRPQNGRTTPDPAAPLVQTQIGEAVTAEVRLPAPVADVPTRRGDNVQDPVRSNSVRSRSSIAKVRLSLYDESPPLDEAPPPMPGQAADVIEQQQLQQLQEQQQQQYQQQQYQQQQYQQGHSADQPHQHRPPALRSIFPQYNPDVPLDEQAYFPTQTSPTRIPRAVISRPLYSPVSPATQQPQAQAMDGGLDPTQMRPTITVSSPAQASTMYSPLSAGVNSPGAVSSATTATPVTRPWPAVVAAAAGRSGATSGSGPTAMVHRDPPTLPVPSTSEELRNFWKVTNGWKAGPSEGRVYCLRMSCDKDSPIYRLSSAGNQPFYRLRLDPTSMSAYVTLSRHDPARPFKMEGTPENANASGGGNDGEAGNRNSVLDMSPPTGGSVLGSVAGTAMGAAGGAGGGNPAARLDGSKNWQVAMTTTLEEEARRHQPQDGLVALLYPAAATRMALERPNDMAMVMTAERECARLVWDDDSGNFFLVHPALALPFCVTIERSTTWSRTAYTLEHLESPQHIARLTRDGTGAGYLEVDTGIASKIDAVYLVDVAVAALVLVAHSDGQFTQVEQFAPPPDGGLGGLGDLGGSPRGSLANMVMGGVVGGRSGSRMSVDRDVGGGGGGHGKGSGRFFGKAKKGKRGARSRLEELDMDLESQTSIDLTSKMFEMGPMGGAQNGSAAAAAAKKRKRKADDAEKMPGCLRLLTALFKCCFWCVAMCVRALIAIVSGLFRCITHEKL